MTPFTQSLGIFYVTIYGGIAIGFLFDLYRALKANFKFLKYFSAVFDICFWIMSTLVIFLTINLTEHFDLRYYHFIALFLGFTMYYYTISRFILKLFNCLISFITKSIKKLVLCIVAFINNLYYVLIYSLHLVFDIIFLVPSIVLRICKRMKKRLEKHKRPKKLKKDKITKKHKCSKKHKSSNKHKLGKNK
jgi:spore cortex biosynthesis protein YabQ